MNSTIASTLPNTLDSVIDGIIDRSLDSTIASTSDGSTLDSTIASTIIDGTGIDSTSIDSAIDDSTSIDSTITAAPAVTGSGTRKPAPAGFLKGSSAAAAYATCRSLLGLTGMQIALMGKDRAKAAKSYPEKYSMVRPLILKIAASMDNPRLSISDGTGGSIAFGKAVSILLGSVKDIRVLATRGMMDSAAQMD